MTVFPSCARVEAVLPLLCALSIAAPPPDQLEREVQVLQTRAEQSRQAYEIVESLTTKVGPRLAGSEAEARARAWAMKAFKELGFDARIEPATVRGWARGKERAWVASPSPQPLRVTALGLSVATPKGGIEAEVIRFGSLYALEQADAEQVRGKIVFIDQAMPKTQDGSGYGAVVGIRAGGATEAARKGAVGVLIRSVGTDHHRFPHTGMLRYDEAVPALPAGALSVPDADQLSRLIDLGDPVRVGYELRPRELGARPTGNVIADLKGAKRPNEIVLLGAHLDSWDLGTGAVDDGAGVGIVMATLALLESMPRRPERTVRVVLFGAEEVGLVGAKAYADAHEEELDDHIITAESDFGAGPVYRLSARVGEAAWPKIESLQRMLSRQRVILGENNRGGGPDLIPMSQRGVPVITPEQDGRDYFDLHHTEDDTLDKIRPDQLSQNVAVYATIAWVVANSDATFRDDAEARARR